MIFIDLFSEFSFFRRLVIFSFRSFGLRGLEVRGFFKLRAEWRFVLGFWLFLGGSMVLVLFVGDEGRSLVRGWSCFFFYGFGVGV